MLSGGYNLHTQRLAVLDSLRELSASSLQSRHEPRKFREAGGFWPRPGRAAHMVKEVSELNSAAADPSPDHPELAYSR